MPQSTVSDASHLRSKSGLSTFKPSFPESNNSTALHLISGLFYNVEMEEKYPFDYVYLMICNIDIILQ